VSADPTPEFSRMMALDERHAHRRFRIEATSEECAAIARRLDLLTLRRLHAEGAVRAGAGGRWTLSGRLGADVVQACVVTLDPVLATVEDAFEIAFAPMDEREDDEVDLTDTDVEPLPADGLLDVGEIITQQLSLALDPFPRAPDAGTGDRIESMEEGPAKVAPFSGLSDRLRGRRGEGSGET
jgi:uncharacterized metal-binding protein YceD (DUF177 family)